MSTYAAIFIQNDKFDGVSVKYDGYIKNGVGQMLYENYNTYEDALELISTRQTDIRELGEFSDRTDFFDDEDPTRYLKFRNLNMQRMMNQGLQFDFLYVMFNESGKHVWRVWNREIGQFEELAKFFK